MITSHSLRALEDTCDMLALMHKGGLIHSSTQDTRDFMRGMRKNKGIYMSRMIEAMEKADENRILIYEVKNCM